jgi:C1A family cysteine protease
MTKKISYIHTKQGLRSQLYLCMFALTFLTSLTAWADLPASFDLRNVNGTNFMTSVKSQSGGTCWAHGTMAALESNMQISGEWKDNAETGDPNLAEYHLDWWNGFNQFNNDDLTPPTGDGLEVHMGGDYRVATAYISRGEGVVRDMDGQSYSTPPARTAGSYHYYYPKHVEWFIDDGESSRNKIKQTIIDHGAIATCMFWDSSFYDSATDSHYQPASDIRDPNHSIAVAGWNDNKTTKSANPGAWLCKNSWGSSWSSDGYFWISYDDKHCCKDEQMGAVSFKNVERQTYLNFYYHDYHGWRDTLPVDKAMNAFIAEEDEDLIAVSFFTAENSVDYSISVYMQFTNGLCSSTATFQTGHVERTGLHTINLDTKVHLLKDDPFYIVLNLSQGGQPYDKTSEIPVLLYTNSTPQQDFETYLETLGKMSFKRLNNTVVTSTADTNQSFYWNETEWIDLTSFDSSANFCIKGITSYPDWDDDDMPNAWEIKFNLNPANSNDRNIDSDNDGMTNYEEWIADTDPTNHNSVLNASIDLNEEHITINFNSSTQRLYRLLSSDNLLSWSDAPDCNVQMGSGSNDTITTSFTNTTTKQYFKIKVKTQ